MSKNGNSNGKTVAETKTILPAMLEQDAVGGLEGLTHDDLATPRLKILMQLSPGRKRTGWWCSCKCL